MHEVLAPFVALSDPELPTSDISLCYAAFIKRFLPYAFNKDEEFLSLQVRIHQITTIRTKRLYSIHDEEALNVGVETMLAEMEITHHSSCTVLGKCGTLRYFEGSTFVRALFL